MFNSCFETNWQRKCQSMEPILGMSPKILQTALVGHKKVSVKVILY